MSDKAPRENVGGADLLQEIRDNRSYADNEWDQIRGEAKKDRLCVAGRPWQALDPEAVKERKETKRPFLTSDELGQYINQTVNDVRANPRGIRYAPTGNGANDAGAEFYQNHTREIEYRSDASVGYARAFEDAVTSSYGWVRVTTKREHLRTFNRELFIEPVVNADQILSDPSAVWPDSRDMGFLFHIEPWSRTEFKRRFPDSKFGTFNPEAQKLAIGWGTDKQVQVALYWVLETVERKLVAYRTPDGEERETLLHELPDGKLPEGVENLREEKVEDSTVCSYLTNGLEILGDKRPWSGRYIPYASCYCKILYVDEGGGSRRQIMSMTRLARDPYMLYCYIRTCEAEAIGGVPRSSWVGYKGQFAKPERWKKANREPVAFLEAEVNIPGNPTNQPLPLPTRSAWDPPLQNLEVAAEAARRAIQAAMGISPQPTEVQRRNDISGKAWERREAMGQKGSFHFKDSYDLMIKRVGVLLEDLITPTLDTARNVAVRKPDESSTIIRINDPRGVGPDGKPQDPIFTKGDYRVTVSTGPATDSQREEGKEFVDAMVGNLQTIAQLSSPMQALKLLAKSIKLKQIGPVGDEIIELLDPPQLGQDGKPLPPEVARLMSENQQLKQILQQAAQEKHAKVVEQQGKFAIAQMQEQAETARSHESNEVKLAVAELSSKVERLALFLEESGLVGARAHEAHQADLNRAHEHGEGARQRVHERLQSRLEHVQAIEQADQGAQIASDAAAQQAALEPPSPTNGAGA